MKITRPRLFFINRFYAPDQSATSQILTDVAEGLAVRGWDVNVITSRINYNQIDQRYRPKEKLNQVTVHRVWTSHFGRGRFLGRAFDYLTFYLSCFVAIFGKVSSNDIVIVKTDPPLLAVFLEPALRFKKAVKVNWLQDIYPEIAEKLGVKIVAGPIGRLLKSMRNRTLKRANLNIAISEAMSKKLMNWRVSANGIERIENFTDDQAIQPRSNEMNELRDQWGFKPSDIVIGYSGNFGRAHDTTTILGAIEALKADARVKFLFIGAGDGYDKLKAEIRAAKLKNALFKPYQDRIDLPISLSVPDIHWLSLKTALDGFLLPSKIYGIMAAGRPVIFVGARDGDLSRLIREEDIGYPVEIGDSLGFVNAINQLAESESVYQRKAENSRRCLEQNFSQEIIIDKWDRTLTKLL